MNKFSKILTAGAFALASISASASDITVGGVTWDPDYQTLTNKDFSASAVFTQWFSNAGFNSAGAPNLAAEQPGFPSTVGSMLQGVGQISSLNGQSDFVCTTCELTFTFGGLVFDGNPINDGSLYDLSASATSGFFNIYFDDSADFNLGSINGQSDVDNAADGSLFLSLSFDFLKEGAGYTADVGTLDSLWSVSGGTAAGQFDTNGEVLGSDIRLDASVNFKGGKYGTSSANASGNSIPEPTSLAIFGLGLLGLAGAARRKA
ncbi:PEP-CTERM sorting domain-containing protein [Colwellia demingiae]|uniref:PEP-CTERM sorting domain-containing protein n=1 Tax=Colwellia demingiae TaxID=89401 RepID=A0A5C6QCA2_9GAMM|nr:PEP-CTERM sorting domain-containing protein [Colwellia demingiae]TWX66373.1 PEP-CTERM sorting domain-containing protein [Colwellia demingiae]